VASRRLGLTAGVLLGMTGIATTLGLGWLVAAAAAMALLAAAPAWPPVRRRLIAPARRVLTPHRARTGCSRSWIPTTDGRVPAVLYTVPEDSGERVWLWCRAGMTAGDLEAARDILRAARWASDVRVVVNDRRSHIVVLEATRRLRPGPLEPYADRSEAGGAGSGEPAAYYGLGLHRPFG
jgi:hypothetical protein